MSPPAGTERKMAGLRLLHSGGGFQSGQASRVEELSELSGLLQQNEEEEEEEEETETEYDMVEREEAADMPPRFAQSLAGRSYGAVSPAVKTRRRKRRNPGQRRSAGSPQTFSEQHPYFSLSPQALRRESELYSLYQLGDQAKGLGDSASALPGC